MDCIDDYVLTPLVETDDPMEDDTPAETGNGNDDDAVTAVTAEDYVQSLVTIESNWANGKISEFNDFFFWFFFIINLVFPVMFLPFIIMIEPLLMTISVA